jgi:hypothetical protein
MRIRCISSAWCVLKPIQVNLFLYTRFGVLIHEDWENGAKFELNSIGGDYFGTWAKCSGAKGLIIVTSYTTKRNDWILDNEFQMIEFSRTCWYSKRQTGRRPHKVGWVWVITEPIGNWPLWQVSIRLVVKRPGVAMFARILMNLDHLNDSEVRIGFIQGGV